MGETLRLGRVRGVAVACNWTVIASAVLIAAVLSTAQFPAQLPDRPAWAYALAGVAAAVLFLASLAVHELAHAVAARHQGIAVRSVTLWVFGGTSRAADEPRDPAADVRVAAVGPLVSLAVAAGLWLAAMLADAAGAPEAAVAVLGWAGAITALLAVFNLVPAAPLDGGRVLRALLWRRSGDLDRATRVAVRAGQVFGALLIAGGLLAFVFMPGLGGLWAALVGGLVALAANEEADATGSESILGGLTVGEVMSPGPLSVPADLDVEAFLDRYVLRTPHSAFPVVRGPRPVGLVTLNRARRVRAQERGSMPVADIACPLDELPVAMPHDPVDALLSRMAACEDGRALVVEAGCLVGMVSSRDVMRQLGVLANGDRRGRLPPSPAGQGSNWHDSEAQHPSGHGSEGPGSDAIGAAGGKAPSAASGSAHADRGASPPGTGTRRSGDGHWPDQRALQ